MNPTKNSFRRIALKYVIGLGANVAGPWGEPKATVENAAGRLAGIGVVQLSPLYRTVPLYRTRQAQFINGALLLDSDLVPRELLPLLKSLEREAGRAISAPRYGPRALDLDILLADRIVLHSADLNVPHPRLHERAFALRPLLDLIPGAIHPITGRLLADHLTDLESSELERLGELETAGVAPSR